MFTPDPPKRLRWTAGAIALLVLGLLILIPSGLCTAAMGVLSIASLGSGNDEWGAILPPMIIGLPFIALGAGLIWLARRLRRKD